MWSCLKHKIWSVPHDQNPNNLRQLNSYEAILLNATIQQIIQRSFDSMVTLARRGIHAEGHAFPDE